jgi:hypothetical protein
VAAGFPRTGSCRAAKAWSPASSQGRRKQKSRPESLRDGFDAIGSAYALAAGATEASSTFTPGPIVEEMATRWM